MHARFRPEARSEAIEARNWYERCSPGLGFEFSRALEATIQAALRSPLSYQPIEGECRRCFMRRFPYSVIYRPDSQGILVIAVFHHRRDPDVWLDRDTR